MQALINNITYDHIQYIEVITENGVLHISHEHINIIGNGLITKIILQNQITHTLNLKGIFYYNDHIFTVINDI